MNDDRRHPKHSLVSAPGAQYEVGYGKPPVATRFQPGKSGNPRGRPRGAKNAHLPSLNEERLKSIVLEEAYRTISVNDTKGPVDVTIAQAVVRSLAVNAAKGNPRAQRLFTQMLASVESENKRLHDEFVQTAINYKVEWDQELERRRRLGLQLQDPVPHPDHVIIDMNTGSVRITGPMTKEEKVTFDKYAEYKADALEEVKELKAILAAEPDHPGRDRIQADIDFVEGSFERAESIIATGRQLPPRNR